LHQNILNESDFYLLVRSRQDVTELVCINNHKLNIVLYVTNSLKASTYPYPCQYNVSIISTRIPFLSNSITLIKDPPTTLNNHFSIPLSPLILISYMYF